MAIFSTAGSHLMIGGARTDWRATVVNASAFDGETWTEIGGTTSLGTTSGEWATQDVTTPNAMAPDQPQIPQVEKTTQPAKTMQLAVDFDATDAGQIKALQAEQAIEAYAFRIVFPDTSERLFIALVIGADDRLDEANNVVGLTFSLILQSNVVRQ